MNNTNDSVHFCKLHTLLDVAQSSTKVGTEVGIV